MLRQKQRRRIGDALQAAFGHREHAELVGRAEPVLDRAYQAETRVRVALEVKHGIDDVLEYPRSGNRTLLGHMPDQDHGNPALFGEPRELRRAFAHLRDAARRRLQRLRIDGLDRVDDHDLGLTHANCRDDCLELHLCLQIDRGVDQTQAPGAHRNLLGRLFPCHV